MIFKALTIILLYLCECTRQGVAILCTLYSMFISDISQVTIYILEYWNSSQGTTYKH